MREAPLAWERSRNGPLEQPLDRGLLLLDDLHELREPPAAVVGPHLRPTAELQRWQAARRLPGS
jgi:hypothetical protein